MRKSTNSNPKSLNGVGYVGLILVVVVYFVFHIVMKILVFCVGENTGSGSGTGHRDLSRVPSTSLVLATISSPNNLLTMDNLWTAWQQQMAIFHGQLRVFTSKTISQTCWN